MDNIELLFDRTLQLSPLDLLKQLLMRVVLLRFGREIFGKTGFPTLRQDIQNIKTTASTAWSRSKFIEGGTRDADAFWRSHSIRADRIGHPASRR